MAATVDTGELDRLSESWERLVKQFPESKRRLLSELGQKMFQKVQGEIGGEGKVAGWQTPYMGSGGGYAAVRAKKDTWQTTKSGKRYAVGHITNAIEGGHKHGGRRGSSRKGYKYRGRIHVAAVPGRWFYAAVRQMLPNMAEEEARELTKLLVDGLEGEL